MSDLVDQPNSSAIPKKTLGGLGHFSLAVAAAILATSHARYGPAPEAFTASQEPGSRVVDASADATRAASFPPRALDVAYGNYYVNWSDYSNHSNYGNYYSNWADYANYSNGN